MNGNVHFWIVCDTIRFIREHGTPAQKQAIQGLQNVYGEKKDILKIPYYESAIEKIVGMESIFTDYYHDLGIYSNAYCKSYTEYNGYIFTALNHFAHPGIVAPLFWWRANGYHYFWSSKNAEDNSAMIGDVDGADVEIDGAISPIMDRVRPFWLGSEKEWSKNNECEIRFTIFPPMHVLAGYYYWRFLCRHSDKLEVKGPYKYIFGLRLLGPIAHAIADLAVPHHVLGTMNEYHAVWENLIEEEVYNWKIDLDPNVVKQILADNNWQGWVYTAWSGMIGYSAVDYWIYLLSLKTMWRTVGSLKLDLNEWYNVKKDHTKWSNYMANWDQMKKDGIFFYNLAIAGTVYLLTTAWNELVKKGIVSPNPGLLIGNLPPEEKGPKYEIIRKRTEGVRVKLPEYKSPYDDANTILHFKPKDSEKLQRRLDEIKKKIPLWYEGEITPKTMEEILDSLKNDFINEFKHMSAVVERKFKALFCPLTMEPINFDPNKGVNPNLGPVTFRLPTIKEASLPRLFDKYLYEYKLHALETYLITLTEMIAAGESLLSRFKPSEVSVRGEKGIEILKTLRMNILTNKEIPQKSLETEKKTIEVGRFELLKPGELPKFNDVKKTS